MAITVIQGKPQHHKWEKGTLLQSKRDHQGLRNVYLLMRNVEEGDTSADCIRLASNGVAEAPAYARDTWVESLELFTGKLEIQN